MTFKDNYYTKHGLFKWHVGIFFNDKNVFSNFIISLYFIFPIWNDDDVQGGQHKTLLHSDNRSSNRMHIVAYISSFDEVIHEYEVRKRTTLCAQLAQVHSRPAKGPVLPAIKWKIKEYILGGWKALGAFFIPIFLHVRGNTSQENVQQNMMCSYFTSLTCWKFVL